MKHILYLNNYLDDEIIKTRKNENIFSQAANNKINGIRKSLEKNDIKVTILSSGLVNNKSFKCYKTKKSLTENVIYCGILDFPIINTITSIISMFLQIKKINRKEIIDGIIFYNYKPEVALVALLCKKIYNIPIILEYEDGYSNLNEINRFKRKIFYLTEKYVGKHIDKAILVNKELEDKIDVPSLVVRGIIRDELINFKKNFNKKPRTKPKIFYSGGLDRERGIKTLIEAIKYIDIDCEILVSGKGEYENLVKECKDERLKYLGYLEYKEMLNIMFDSDVLLQCQIVKSEFSNASFPSKIYEYLATGNKIVSSNIPDVKDVGEGIFYFYNDDSPFELANSIKLALTDKDINEYNNSIIELNTEKSVGNKIIDLMKI